MTQSSGNESGRATAQGIYRFLEGFTYQYARYRLTDACGEAAFGCASWFSTLLKCRLGTPVPGIPMRRMMLVVLLPMLWSVAHAQQVYKCTDGKQVSYQSQPCDSAQRTLRQWDATPEPVPTGAQATQTAKARAVPARKSSSRRSTSGSTRSRPDPAESRCQVAKSKREAKLRAVGLKRTFDMLRKLDEAVYVACR